MSIHEILHSETLGDEDLIVLTCWVCHGADIPCRKFANSGMVFWVDGRAYPYTPAGEKEARKSKQ